MDKPSDECAHADPGKPAERCAFLLGKAMKLLLALVERYAETTEAKVQLGDLLAEDQTILAQYLVEPKASAGELAELLHNEGEGDDD